MHHCFVNLEANTRNRRDNARPSPRFFARHRVNDSRVLYGRRTLIQNLVDSARERAFRRVPCLDALKAVPLQEVVQLVVERPAFVEREVRRLTPDILEMLEYALSAFENFQLRALNVEYQ